MSRTYARSIDFLEAFFEQRFPFGHNLLQNASQVTSLSKRFLIQVLFTIKLFLLLLCCWSKITKLAILYLYPIRGTFISLQDGNPEEAVRWLMFWTVFGTVQCFFGLFGDFIGFLYVINYLLVIWSFLPIEYNGSAVIYTRIIRPVHRQLCNTSLDSLGVDCIQSLAKCLSLKIKNRSGRQTERDKSQETDSGKRKLRSCNSNSKNVQAKAPKKKMQIIIGSDSEQSDEFTDSDFIS